MKQTAAEYVFHFVVLVCLTALEMAPLHSVPIVHTIALQSFKSITEEKKGLLLIVRTVQMR